MTLEELKTEISERIESEQKRQERLHKRGNADCISNCG